MQFSERGSLCEHGSHFEPMQLSEHGSHLKCATLWLVKLETS